MSYKTHPIITTLTGVLVLFGLGAFGLLSFPIQVNQADLTQPPHPLLTPLPNNWRITPSPQNPPISTPVSIWASQALSYITEKYGVPRESLLVVNEHERTYPLSESSATSITHRVP